VASRRSRTVNADRPPSPNTSTRPSVANIITSTLRCSTVRSAVSVELEARATIEVCDAP
jgi:hypothetical protein